MPYYQKINIMKKIYFLFMVSFLFFQCDPPHADLTAYKLEKEKKELKKISKADLMVLAQQKINVVLPKLESGGNIDSLAKTHHLRIKKILVGDSSDIQKENMILAAYVYNSENNIPFIANEQLIDNLYLYNSPITKEKSLLGLWSIRINLFELAKE